MRTVIQTQGGTNASPLGSRPSDPGDGGCAVAGLRESSTGVAAEDFKRGSDTREAQVCTADTFTLQALHPVADSLR